MDRARKLDEQARRPDRTSEVRPAAGIFPSLEPLTAEQGVPQLQQTVGNRVVQRALASPTAAVSQSSPGMIQRHITPSAESALESLNMSLPLLMGNVLGASADAGKAGQDVGIAMGKVYIAQAGSNPPMPEGTAKEEIQVPATAGV